METFPSSEAGVLRAHPVTASVVRPRALRASRRTPWLAIAFVLSLAWPTAYSLALGSLELAPYRMLLLLGSGVVLWRLVQGKLRFATADYLVLFFAFWMAASVMINHGLFTPFTSYSARDTLTSVGYEATAIAVLETAGAYFLARAAVSGPVQFAAVMKTFGWVTLAVCLFAMVEAKTGNNLFGAVATAGTGEVRFGLHRAAGPFPHSILWGLFAAVPFAFFAARSLKGWGATSPLFALASLVGVVTSVSTTAVLALAVQALGIGWAWIARVRRKWTFLMIGLAVGYVIIEIMTPRSGFEEIMSRMSFSKWNGYIRLYQWDHGWANAVQHPFFGIGFNDWMRPDWLAGSIDSYWLVLAVRHGLFVPALLIAAIALLLLQASRAYREAYASLRVRLLIRIWAVTVISLAVAGISVHYWAQSAVVFFFLLGCIGAFSAPQPSRRRGA